MVWEDVIDIFNNEVPTRPLTPIENTLGKAILECFYAEQTETDQIEQSLTYFQQEALYSEMHADEYDDPDELPIIVQANKTALEVRADQFVREFDSEQRASGPAFRQARIARDRAIEDLVRRFLTDLGHQP